MRLLKYVVIFPIKAPSGRDQTQHLYNDTGLIELYYQKERDQTQVTASQIQNIVKCQLNQNKICIHLKTL